jgi:hypothetical protein
MKNLKILIPIVLLVFCFSCNEEPVKEEEEKQKEVAITVTKELTEVEKKHEQIKKEYELIGAWKINNSFTKYSYEYEIYNKEEEFIGVRITSEIDFETINKEGKKYVVKGNEYGEYYILDSKNNITLFDKDGELKSAGYTAKKK